MAKIRIDIWRGKDDEPEAGVRLKAKVDQIEWHSRDKAYTVEFVGKNPFEGDPDFDVSKPTPVLTGDWKTLAEGEYKFRVIDNETGKILDPTIFVDP